MRRPVPSVPGSGKPGPGTPSAQGAGYTVSAYKGYFIGCYAEPFGTEAFIGRAQICVERPESAASARVVELVTSVGSYNHPFKAAQAAQFQARQVVEGLKPNWAPFTEPGMTRK